MSHKNTPSLLSILILLAASLPAMSVPAAGAPKAAALRAAELESEIAELKATIAELEQTLEDKAEQVTALRQTRPEPEPESSSATEALEPAGDEILTAELPASSEEVAEEEVAQAPQSLGNPPLSKDQPLAGQEYQQFQDYYDEFLNLGVRRDYQAVERYNTVEQINTFIPPLYQPAFVGHGYILPPGAMRVSAGFSFIDVNPDDFFKGGKTDFVHENHGVNRLRADVDFLYGLDHNMTLRLNVPYLSSRSTGSVHPAGVKTMDLFAEGSTQAIGDASLMLKKKWVDQGNFYFNFATVTGIKLPNGSDHEEFDQHLVVKTPDGALGTAFGGGPFPRSTDDGSLAIYQGGAHCRRAGQAGRD